MVKGEQDKADGYDNIFFVIKAILYEDLKQDNFDQTLGSVRKYLTIFMT